MAGRISGAEEQDRSRGTVIALAVGLILLAAKGILYGLAGTVLVGVAWGLQIRIEKRRAGASLESTDY